MDRRLPYHAGNVVRVRHVMMVSPWSRCKLFLLDGLRRSALFCSSVEYMMVVATVPERAPLLRATAEVVEFWT